MIFEFTICAHMILSKAIFAAGHKELRIFATGTMELAEPLHVESTSVPTVMYLLTPAPPWEQLP
jgi:hypothetical protein